MKKILTVIDKDYVPDYLPESRAARWAWRVSLIPFLGVPLFMILAFIALNRIGSKGQTGFWLLRRGVIALFLIDGIYFGIYLSGFLGYYPKAYNALYSYLPKHGFEETHYIMVYTLGEKPGPGIESVSWWQFGEHTGKCIYFYPSGEKNSEGYLRNGEYEGKWTVFHVNGHKIREGQYANGVPVGLWSQWVPGGEAISPINYGENGRANGKVMWLWHDNGQKCYEIEYNQGLRIRETGWYDDGQKARESKFPGIENRITWHTNGQKRSEGQSRDNRNEGAFLEWYDNGHKKIQGVYRTNRKIDVWQYWDKSGRLEKQELYNNTGDMIRGDEYQNERPTKTTFYKKGKPIKTIFYTDGNPVKGKK